MERVVFLLETSEGRRNRTRLDIIANILSISLSGAKKTHIMYRANLSYRQLQEYLGFLMKRGLLRRNKGGNLYETSERGTEFLKSFQILKRNLSPSESLGLEAKGEIELIETSSATVRD